MARHLCITLLLAAGGCGSDEEERPVSQPTQIQTRTSPRRKPPPRPTRAPIVIRSNTQTIFEGAKIAAGNFEASKKGSAGQTLTPATAKLWTALQNDPSTQRVTQVKVGDSFTVGKHRFLVTAIRVPKQEEQPRQFMETGSNMATITVVVQR